VSGFQIGDKVSVEGTITGATEASWEKKTPTLFTVQFNNDTDCGEGTVWEESLILIERPIKPEPGKIYITNVVVPVIYDGNKWFVTVLDRIAYKPYTEVDWQSWKVIYG